MVMCTCIDCRKERADKRAEQAAERGDVKAAIADAIRDHTGASDVTVLEIPNPSDGGEVPTPGGRDIPASAIPGLGALLSSILQPLADRMFAESVDETFEGAVKRFTGGLDADVRDMPEHLNRHNGNREDLFFCIYRATQDEESGEGETAAIAFKYALALERLSELQER